MESVARNPKTATPAKDPHGVKGRDSQNKNPNVARSSPGLKSSGSPAVKSAKTKKSASKNPMVCSPTMKIGEIKFVEAKKKKKKKKPEREEGEEEKSGLGKEMEGVEVKDEVRPDSLVETGSREKLLEQGSSSVPKFGKVKNLVSAFEEMLTLKEYKKEQEDQKEEDEKEVKRKASQLAFPGLQFPAKVADADQGSSSTFCPSDLFLTSENLGLDLRFSGCSSRDGSQGRTSSGGRRSRRNSSESCRTMGGGRRGKKKKVKATSQKPFKLRTEQRGKMKEEEFIKKLQEMTIEEEKQRVPVAQGLPWTTDEPECLVKPPVKEKTRPVDLKLHSDVRAVERAEFNQQVSEKWSLIEQYKMERDRQQKLAAEEELRRLRKELIPKAQPMPYFDRPFIPKKIIEL